MSRFAGVNWHKSPAGKGGARGRGVREKGPTRKELRDRLAPPKQTDCYIQVTHTKTPLGEGGGLEIGTMDRTGVDVYGKFCNYPDPTPEGMVRHAATHRPILYAHSFSIPCPVARLQNHAQGVAKPVRPGFARGDSDELS